MLCQLSYTHHLDHSIHFSASCRRLLEYASVARQKGFEPLTHGLEGRCSFHLSYWRVVGASRFERPTPCSQGRCATKLRYAPSH